MGWGVGSTSRNISKLLLTLNAQAAVRLSVCLCPAAAGLSLKVRLVPINCYISNILASAELRGNARKRGGPQQAAAAAAAAPAELRDGDHPSASPGPGVRSSHIDAPKLGNLGDRLRFALDRIGGGEQIDTGKVALIGRGHADRLAGWSSRARRAAAAVTTRLRILCVET